MIRNIYDYCSNERLKVLQNGWIERGFLVLIFVLIKRVNDFNFLLRANEYEINVAVEY